MHVVLVHPDIAGNTGNVGRTCVATNSTLHLVKPMGFEISDKHLKRAGLDYWEHLDLRFVESMEQVEATLFVENNFFLFSRFATQSHWDANFTKDSVLVFGSETKGLPKELLEKYPDRVFGIPMTGPVRSLNLATAVGSVVFEAVRQSNVREKP